MAGSIGSARAATPSLDTLIDSLLGATTHSRLTTIQLPGKSLTAFDISTTDPRLPLYYLADITNASPDVFDTRSNTLQAQIGGFAGLKFNPATHRPSFDLSGPLGVTVVRDGEVWVADGDSSIKIVDLFAQTIVATISTVRPGEIAALDKRADEMALDPRDGLVIASNPSASPPYVSFISTRTHQVVGQLSFTDALGIEQSVYNPVTDLFYFSLPQLVADPNAGAVVIIDPLSMKEIERFAVNGCSGNGLALDPANQKFLLGCSDTNGSQIISARNGALLAVVTQVSGSDEVTFNPGDGNFYLGASGNVASDGTTPDPAVGVIHAANNRFVANILTAAASFTHSVAVGPHNNHVFVPSAPIAGDLACANGCIQVFASQSLRGPPAAWRLCLTTC